RFHAYDALGRERLVAYEELRVLLGVDVVRDHRDVQPVAQGLAQREREGGLARPHRAADADAQSHDRKSLEYCVSCFAESIANPGAKLPSSFASGNASERESKSLWPSVCPSGIALTAAMTWFSSHAQR